MKIPHVIPAQAGIQIPGGPDSILSRRYAHLRLS